MESAFPVNTEDVFVPSQGMTLRDYFAAKALPAVMDEYAKVIRLDGYPESVDRRCHMASEAYLMADAMMKAREGVQSGS